MIPTKILPSAALPQHFARVADPFDRSIQQRFEAGEILVFDDFPLISAEDLKFLSQFGPVADSKLTRKAAEPLFLKPMAEDWRQAHLLGQYTQDEGLARALQTRVADISQRFRDYFAKIFPGYGVERIKNSWRFTATRDNAMHFDNYYRRDTFYIRMFVNLDTEPRIWRTSHHVPDVYDQFRADLQGLGPEEICFRLNQLLFVTEDKALRDDQPYHEFHFAPGTAWLVHSQRVSHQIIYGNKLLAFTGELPANSMADPGLCYDGLLRSAGHTTRMDPGAPILERPELIKRYVS